MTVFEIWLCCYKTMTTTHLAQKYANRPAGGSFRNRVTKPKPRAWACDRADGRIYDGGVCNYGVDSVTIGFYVSDQ